MAYFVQPTVAFPPAPTFVPAAPYRSLAPQNAEEYKYLQKQYLKAVEKESLQYEKTMKARRDLALKQLKNNVKWEVNAQYGYSNTFAPKLARRQLGEAMRQDHKLVSRHAQSSFIMSQALAPQTVVAAPAPTIIPTMLW